MTISTTRTLCASTALATSLWFATAAVAQDAQTTSAANTPPGQTLAAPVPPAPPADDGGLSERQVQDIIVTGSALPTTPIRSRCR